MRRVIGVLLLTCVVVTSCTKSVDTIEAAATTSIRPTDPVVAFALGSWSCVAPPPMIDLLGWKNIEVGVQPGTFTARMQFQEPFGPGREGLPDSPPWSGDGQWEATGTWKLDGTRVQVIGTFRTAGSDGSNPQEGTYDWSFDEVGLDVTSVDFSELVQHAGTVAVVNERSMTVVRDGDDAIAVDGFACRRTR